MRIIVGVDGSAGSLAAVRFVGRLLAEETAPLYLYYSPPSINFIDQAGIDPETLERVEKSLVEAVFERAKEQLPLSLRSHVVTIQGKHKAKHGLLVAADEHQSDLIVVGLHGTRPLEWLRVGSVSRSVAQAATVPVLVVRQSPEDEPAVGIDTPFRVVVACDRTDLSDFTKSFIQRFGWPVDTQGEVMTVYESYFGEVPDWLQETLVRESGLAPGERFEPFAADKHHALDQLTQWCADLPPSFRTQPPQLVEGHPARAIVDHLQSQPYDLVIVGARRQGVVGRMLLGSTSYAVLTHAPCSVLIVREHERP
jgi:nucleotide-binding universal stress UspA family protein